MNIENLVIIVCILIVFYLYSNKKENFNNGEIPLDLTNKHSLCPPATNNRSPKCIDGESLGTGTCYAGGKTVNISKVNSSYVPGATNSYEYYRCTNPQNPFKPIESCPTNATKIVHSDGVHSQCVCRTGFQMSNDRTSCNCPAYSDLIDNQCVCRSGFQMSNDRTSCNCPTFYQLNNGQCEFKPFTVMSLADLQSVNSIYNNEVARI